MCQGRGGNAPGAWIGTSAVRSRLPRSLGDSEDLVAQARRREQKGGKPVRIRNGIFQVRAWISGRRFQYAPHHAPLRPSTDRPCHVRPCGAGISARQYEALKRRQLGLQPVDCGLQAPRLLGAERGQKRCRSRVDGGCQPRTQTEKFPLRFQQLRAKPEVFRGKRCNERAKGAVQLIHVAAGFDAAVSLGHSLSAQEAGLAAVTAARIRFHRFHPPRVLFMAGKAYSRANGLSIGARYGRAGPALFA